LFSVEKTENKIAQALRGAYRRQIDFDLAASHRQIKLQKSLRTLRLCGEYVYLEE